MRVPFRRAAVLVAAALLVPAAAAQAKPKPVVIGIPKKAAGEFQNKYSADVNAFFPSRVTIRQGQKVRFIPPVGFHTLDIPPSGGTALPLFTPQGQISGVTDANGALFWFNGLGNQQFNPQLLVGNFGKSFKRQGNSRIESGLPLGPGLKPITVKFPDKGTFKVFCDIHPGMVGRVVVKGRHAHVPTAKQDRKRVKKQLTAARKRAKKLKNHVPAGNTVSVGGHAKGGVEYFGMLPAVKTVAQGTTVRFAMPVRSTETHTATFGPTSYLGPIEQSFEMPPVDQRGVYPSEKPGTVAAYTSALHGNGFWNSGAMDRDASSPPGPSNDLTFNTPGTYDYYCVIHPFMHGQIKVT